MLSRILSRLRAAADNPVRKITAFLPSDMFVHGAALKQKQAIFYNKLCNSVKRSAFWLLAAVVCKNFQGEKKLQRSMGFWLKSLQTSQWKHYSQLKWVTENWILLYRTAVLGFILIYLLQNCSKAIVYFSHTLFNWKFK